MHYLAERYLRKSALPTLFCPGCGNGQILNAAVRAIDALGIRKDVAAVSGIGCSSWIPVYINIDVLHTLHGRAIAFAQGLKLSRPEKKILVFTGDGDCLGIGGNHLIHAARRNIDITVIMANNLIYGMTGGQKAPTTPVGSRTKTSPYGNTERPLDAAGLAIAAGATFVARWTTAHPVQMQNAIQEAIEHRGFSFVEIMTQCPVQAGRHIFGKTDPWEIMEWYKAAAIPASGNDGPKEGGILVGELYMGREEEFTDLVAKERDQACSR